MTVEGPARLVPVVALPSSTDSPDDVVSAIDEVCRTSGFLVVTEHGVPGPVLGDMLDVTASFFSLPLEEKLAAVGPDGTYRGYRPVAMSSLAATLDEATPPDLVEFFCCNRFDDPVDAVAAGATPELDWFFAPNVWPVALVEMRLAWMAYYRAMEDLAGRLMRLFALALGLEATFFEPFIEHHISNLLANHYPAQPEPPLPGQLRRGAHTDFGSLTILYQDDAPGGLQVRDPDGWWHDVPFVPGSFVVNLGDLMQRWTNDRWVSTLHRVVNPDRGDRGSDRTSIAFFHQPSFHARIECLPTCRGVDGARHEPTTSGPWLLEKMAKGY